MRIGEIKRERERQRERDTHTHTGDRRVKENYEERRQRDT